MNTTPLTILTGFLGAGKTTFLNNILHADHGLRIAVLVNDFGAINIDSMLVTSVDGDAVSLSNGCICCTIRGDLLQAVKDLFVREEPPEYVIIEASGVSDPMEIALTFKTPEMEQLVHIDSIISVIDAEQYLDIAPDHTVLAMNQVGMADIILLNKVDLVDEATLQEVERTLRHIMADARIIRTSHGDVLLEMVLGIGKYDPARLMGRAPSDVHVHGEHDHHDHEHTDHSLVFNTWNWTSTAPLSLKEVKRVVQKLPTSIYRAKGVLYIHDEPERAVLQVVGRRATLQAGEPWGDQTPRSEFVVIGAPDGVHPAELQALFDACLYENAPKSELERLTRNVLSWLRPTE